MTKNEAKRLAVLKWQWILNNWDYKKNYHSNDEQLKISNPEIVRLRSSCSFCEAYQVDADCHNCPLKEKRYTCCWEFNQWNHCARLQEAEPASEHARNMLNKILILTPENGNEEIIRK